MPIGLILERVIWFWSDWPIALASGGKRREKNPHNDPSFPIILLYDK